MKKCSRCHSNLSFDSFTKRTKSKDSLHSWCRECTKSNDNFREGKRSVNASERNRRRRHKINRAIDDYLLEHPCIDCGEKDIIILEFDHINDDKEFTIGAWSSLKVNLEQIMNEIAKCEVRCVNCHRRITAKRNQWIRYLWQERRRAEERQRGVG